MKVATCEAPRAVQTPGSTAMLPLATLCLDTNFLVTCGSAGGALVLLLGWPALPVVAGVDEGAEADDIVRAVVDGAQVHAVAHADVACQVRPRWGCMRSVQSLWAEACESSISAVKVLKERSCVGQLTVDNSSDSSMQTTTRL